MNKERAKLDQNHNTQDNCEYWLSNILKLIIIIIIYVLI